jgi:acetyl-CoA/propionyl-CoA carboxylase carboxyl transferase subunit
MTALAASPQPDLTAVAPPRDPGDVSDPRDPMVRIERLGEITEVLNDADAVVVAALVADGVPMIAFATDPRRQGGAMGTKGCEALYQAYEVAVERGCPVVGIWHSGGARLTEGVDSLHGVGRVFAAMTLASGKIPQLSLVLGPAAGGAAYGPALTDVVIMGPEGRIFVTGPDVVRSVTGEDVDMARLGGPEPHGRSSGLASVVAATDDEAYAATRRIAALLAGPKVAKPVFDRQLGGFLPDRPARAYDVKPLIAAILDEAPTELHGKWAPNLVTALGTIGGRTVGVLANNPLRLGGCLDAAAGDKAARFVRMCDAFGVPLLVVVDVPGYLPGTGQEWNGVVRRGAKLLHAFAAASVPRITLVTRKAYGGAYIAMNSRALGATHVLAWPNAQVDVMGAVAAVRILHRRQLAAVSDEEKPLLEAQLAEAHLAASGGLSRAIEGGMVDEIIEPDVTRTRLAALLIEHPSDRGTHGNIPL